MYISVQRKAILGQFFPKLKKTHDFGPQYLCTCILAKVEKYMLQSGHVYVYKHNTRYRRHLDSSETTCLLPLSHYQMQLTTIKLGSIYVDLTGNSARLNICGFNRKFIFNSK